MHNIEGSEINQTETGKSSVLTTLSPKSSFLIGLVGGIMLLSTIGFAIMLSAYLRGTLVSSTSKVAGAKATNNANVAVANTNNSNTAPAAAPSHVDFTISDTDHTQGNKNAKVKIVEYSDIQCPYCASFQATMQQVMQKYPNDVLWVFRNFPLDSIHPNARPAAIAAECVNTLKGNDAFWQFLDKMYSSQSSLGADFYNTTAQGIGVDMTKFKDCVTNQTTNTTVEAQYQDGVKNGVQGTPGDYLNGDELGGAVPFAQLDAKIQAILSK